MKKTNLLIITTLSIFMSGCNGEKVYYGSSDTEEHEPKKTQTFKENSDFNNKNKKPPSRISRKHTSICPKLLRKNIDNSEIYRSKEFLNGNYCDYYIYPNIGQVLSVKPDNSQLSAFLVMPKNHDFANGTYIIKERRRHIIRVFYNGIEHKPHNFIYAIEFDLKD